MQKILKYKLHIISNMSLSMPKNARILTVQVQKGLLQIWVLVDTKETQEETREFSVVTTGEQFNPFNQDYVYIGTFQTENGNFVGHLFEIV